MPNFNFLACSKAEIWRGSIYKLCLWMPEENNINVMFQIWDIELMIKNVNLGYISQNHFSVKILKYLVYRWKMSITVEFNFLACCILISDEYTYLLTTSYPMPKLRSL